MYIPKHFEITKREEIFSFVEENNFGRLISTHQGQLYSTHLPFFLDKEKSTIKGHLAMQNPQHKDIDGQQVLVTLEGPHDYITPSWYAGAGVPTWNYQAVHLYGVCQTFRDENRLKELVSSLTQQHELGFETPWQPEYADSMLSAIIGVEVKIETVQCKFKLSQNQPMVNQINVARQLDNIGSVKLAKAMRKSMQEQSSPES